MLLCSIFNIFSKLVYNFYIGFLFIYHDYLFLFIQINNLIVFIFNSDYYDDEESDEEESENGDHYDQNPSPNP